MALNLGSPFRSGFSLSLRGGFFHYLSNVPAANTLYMKATNPNNPASGPQDNVYGAFIPSAQSYGGTGACVMAFADLTMLEPGARRYELNRGMIGPPITAAVHGACKLGGAPTPAAVPTLGEWGLLLISAALASLGLRRLRPT